MMVYYNEGRYSLSGDTFRGVPERVLLKNNLPGEKNRTMCLYDRQYFRDSGEERYHHNNNAIWGLIAINVIAYLLIAPPGSYLNDMLALYSNSLNFRPWQLITSGFLHANFSHILFNMWGLHIFGTLVIPYIGTRNFIILYLAGVLSGNLLYIVLNWGGSSVLLGASGAICAVMMAAALCEPNRRFVMLFMPFMPLKTSTLVICYTILEILMQFGGKNDGIAHLAHLGGFIGGYAVMKILRGRNLAWDPFRRRKNTAYSQTPPFTSPFGSKKATTFRAEDAAGTPVSSRELDYLLEKVSREGINSLSEYELGRLKQAREQMRGSGR